MNRPSGLEERKMNMAKLIRVDRNGTKYYVDYKCPKCGGEGHIRGYEHIQDGQCFLCGGSGIHQTTWKEYTPEYAKKLEERRTARAIAKSEDKNAKFLEKKGFSKDGHAWVVLGDTFKIKDELKALGCHYHGLLGWYSDHDLEGYKTLKVSIDDCYGKDYAYTYQECLFLTEIMDTIREANASLDPTVDSEYIGEVGQRITAKVRLVKTAHYSQRSFSGYGTTTTYIYTFKDENGNALIWKTTSILDHEIDTGNGIIFRPILEDEEITLKGTVKEHSTYKGEKQTVLTRCKIA